MTGTGLEVAGNGLGLGAFVALVLMLVVLLALFGWSWGRRRGTRLGRQDPGPALRSVGEARLERGERQASLVGEQIEEMVRERLRKYPELAAVRLDFGTGSRGELEIWVGQNRYGAVKEIPDARIREAVAEAVAAFNR